MLLFLVAGTARSQKPASDAARADAAAYQAICGTCHPTSLGEGLRAQSEWKETIAVMVQRGMVATDEELAGVMRHLLRTQTKVNVNTAAAPEIAAVLDIGDSSAKALVKRRTELGAFRTLEDLKKAPGIDAAKIEARKDRIAFR